MFLGKENPVEQDNIHMFKVGIYHEYTLDLYYLIWTMKWRREFFFNEMH